MADAWYTEELAALRAERDQLLELLTAQADVPSPRQAIALPPWMQRQWAAAVRARSRQQRAAAKAQGLPRAMTRGRRAAGEEKG